MRARHLHSAPMAPRPQLRLLTAIFGCLAAIALGACGSSGPENGLTQEQSDKLVGALENLQDDISSGECEEAESKLTSIRGDIDAIAAEGNVDKEIITGLGELVDQTDTLLADCTASEEPEETTSSSTTSTTESEPTETETTTTDTDTEPEEEEPEPEPEPEPDPEPEEPPSDNAPPGPEGNPNDEGGFDPDNGGLSPGQERKGGSKPAKDKPAKPGKDEKKRMLSGGAPPRADQENETR